MSVKIFLPQVVKNYSVALIMDLNMDGKESVAELLIKCLGLLHLPTCPTTNMLCGQISLGDAKILGIYTAE